MFNEKCADFKFTAVTAILMTLLSKDTVSGRVLCPSLGKL